MNCQLLYVFFVNFEIFIQLETETFGAKLQFNFVMLLQLFNFLIANFMQRPIVSRRFQKCKRQGCFKVLIRISRSKFKMAQKDRQILIKTIHLFNPIYHYDLGG